MSGTTRRVTAVDRRRRESGLSFYDNLEIIFHNIYRERSTKKNCLMTRIEKAIVKWENGDESIKSIKIGRTDDKDMGDMRARVCGTDEHTRTGTVLVLTQQGNY